MADPHLSDFELHLFAEGTLLRLYQKLGAQCVLRDGESGVQFTLWAPHARGVSVVGDFNGWDPAATPLQRIGHGGLWTTFVPHVGSGARYKFSSLPLQSDHRLDKADPVAFQAEHPPRNASQVCDLSGHSWQDGEWIARRRTQARQDAPLAAYEVHLGSWMRTADPGNGFLNDRELASRLADYALEMGFTHITLLPLGEHTDNASWGDPTTLFFAPSARYGSPHELMAFVDRIHQSGLGVLLEWPIGQFARDPHGLERLDGQPLYERADAIPATSSSGLVFNIDSPQVANFLLASADYWLSVYHIDGLRVTGLDDLLYPERQTVLPAPTPERQTAPIPASPPPANPAALAFLRRLGRLAAEDHGGSILIAGSGRYDGSFTRPLTEGGLGFHYRCDDQWSHAALDDYFTLDPSDRPARQDVLARSALGARGECRLISISRATTTGPAGSLLHRLPGDEWRKFANLRLFLGLAYTLPGKKSLFMGTELGPWRASDPRESLDWHVLDLPRHSALRRWVRDLNTQYRAQPALHAGDCHPEGFSWNDLNDRDQCVICYFRRWDDDLILIVCNHLPELRHNYRVGVPRKGPWEEILNSDATLYSGSGQGNMGGVNAAPLPWNGYQQSLTLILPPLALVAFRAPKG